MTKKQFDIIVNDEPGEIAQVAEALAKYSVNIRAITTEKRTNGVTLRIITDDDITTRRALSIASIPYYQKDISIITVSSRPGELHKLTEKLAKGGVNIESILSLVGSSQGDEIAIAVDHQEGVHKLIDPF